MSKPPPADSDKPNDDAPAEKSASSSRSDTFEVSTRLTLNTLKFEILELKAKLFRLDAKVDTIISKVDTILSNTAPRLPCIFCEGDNEDGHRASACPVFPDPISRSFRLRDLNKCIACLAPAHGSCSHKCRSCGGPHHAILCTDRSKQGPSMKRPKPEN
ncbi:hypothetical protein GCK32_022824 [Trichostrongylus colubriformis]|uniref:CCHC-type domain-containing protein n=1 Tax=Trichostrongylus colubriformis TaxID=6319 RepID=A0AAN8IUL6_TRICO